MIVQAHQAKITGVSFDPAGKQVASVGEDKLLRLAVFDPARPNPKTMAEQHPLTCLEWSPDGSFIATGDSNGNVHLILSTYTSFKLTYKRHHGTVEALAWSPDGRWLASVGSDQRIVIADAKTKQVHKLLNSLSERVLGLLFSPDGQSLVWTSNNNTLHSWDLQQDKLSAQTKPLPAKISALALDSQNRRLAVGLTDGDVLVMDLSNFQIQLKVHTGPVCGLAFNPQTKTLVSAGKQHVRVWNLVSYQEIAKLPCKTNELSCLSLSPGWTADCRR